MPSKLKPYAGKKMAAINPSSRRRKSKISAVAVMDGKSVHVHEDGTVTAQSRRRQPMARGIKIAHKKR